MSQYLAFVMHLADSAKWPESLSPLFKQQFFTPVSLVGTSSRKASLDFFLSGYAIVDLPGDHLLGNGWQTNEVHIAPPTDEHQFAYLQSIARGLKSGKPWSFIDSEFELETFDRQRHVSLLAAPPLEPSALLECQSWAAGRKRIWLKMFGTVDFACDRKGFADLQNWFRGAWRCSDGSIADWHPFLKVTMEVPDERRLDQALFHLGADSSIWLANPEPVRSPMTLGGQMTPAIADQFVDRYASLCRHLVEAHRGRIQSVSVGLGDAFWRERQRLEDAFRARIDNCPVPLDFW